MSNDDTLIAQLQARNAALSSERDACRDESRRLAMKLADSQVECERLRAALQDIWHEMHGGDAWADVTRSVRRRIDAALAGPMRDESVPPPAVTPDDVAFAEKHGSPVTRSEPSRAEPVLPGLQALQYANEEALRGQVEREIADWLDGGAQRCDPSKRSFASRIRWGEYRSDAALDLGIREEHPSGGAEHPMWASSSGADEDQPQPACPPDWHDLGDGRCYFTIPECAVTYAQAWVAAERLPPCEAPYCPPDCTGTCDPAPEAQRAQSESARDIRTAGDILCQVGDAMAKRRNGSAEEVLAEVRKVVGTPAPNITAAVAELEAAEREATNVHAAGELRAIYRTAIPRALAHLRAAAAPVELPEPWRRLEPDEMLSGTDGVVCYQGREGGVPNQAWSKDGRVYVSGSAPASVLRHLLALPPQEDVRGAIADWLGGDAPYEWTDTLGEHRQKFHTWAAERIRTWPTAPRTEGGGEHGE